MKVYTNKFNDSFYLPVINNSCRDELGYQVAVNDTYGLLSIENTIGPGPKNDIYITVPKVPSNLISQGTLYAKKRPSGEYYLEIAVQNSIFKVYENGKRFYLFYSDGSYSDIYIDLIGYNGEFPNFLIDEKSLKKLIGGGTLPTTSTPVLLNSPYSISTEFETRNFLKVSTSTLIKGQQAASITLRGLQTNGQLFVYDFVIDPVDVPVKAIEQPPIGIKTTETSQLSRSFIPVSSIVTLQVDSSGELYMDKLYSGSSTSQTGYRRRCTNLGFEKDLSRFCASIPKPSLYSFNDNDFTSSTTNLSEQYFTDLNSGVSINVETEEGFRMFAPLWLKDMIPSYFAIFRRSATNSSNDLLSGASLVTLIDINKTELGPYLAKLMKNESFIKAPLEVSIDQGYSLKWNGVSVDSGYWMTHTEFIGIDIQQGLSDFEFNEILSGGFSRGSIVSPQFLNIEFLFNDNETKLYDVNQYFGLYCDDVELSRFIPNVDSTSVLFRQNETRPTSNSDFNSSVISNPDGVKLVVDLNETPDRNFSVSDASTMVVDAIKVSSRYPISILPTTASSRLLKVDFTSDYDLTSKFSNGSQIRLEDENRNFISYITVASSTYSSNEKKMNVVFEENDTYSKLGLSYWVNVFDFSPDVSPSIPGSVRMDSNDASKSRCIVFSNQDLLGNEIETWLNSVVDQGSMFRDSLVLFDKSSSAYAILLANSTSVEDDYIKVFFDVLETNGSFVQGDEVFVNISEYDVDGAIPGPSVINSSTRKFILRSKHDAYSVKSFNFANYKNSVIGTLSLDSKTFNLGSIVGTGSTESIPVEAVEVPYTGIGLKFPSSFTESISYGDRITVEQIIGTSKRRWSVIRSEQPVPQVSKIPGAVTEVSVVDGTFVSNDSYTEFEIEPGSYFPVRFDSFDLIGSLSQQSNVPLDFISAEEQDNGNYLLTFANTNVGSDYQSLRVSIPDTDFTYFNYTETDSLETVIAVAFQRFVDCPFRSATSEGALYLYSPVASTNISVGLYFSYGTITQMEINGTMLKPKSVVKDSIAFSANHYTYKIESLKDKKLYSIEEDFLSRLENGTKILSKSGTPLTVSQWNNRSYGIPNIRSIVEDGEQRMLIKFDGSKEPSLLNGRLQLVNSNTVSLSLLSFYDFIDLDFFEEIPLRIGTNLDGFNMSLSTGSSIFSQKKKTIETINSSTSSSNQKTLVLSVNIAENVYSDWKNWEPSNNPDFLAYGKPKGSIVPSDTLPTTWNPSYGFKVQYLNPSGEWVDYQLNYPTVSMTTPVVKFYSFVPSKDPMWELTLAYPFSSTSDSTSFSDVQQILNGLITYMYMSSFSERIRAFSEIKRLVSYCFKELSVDNIDESSEIGTYIYKMVLSIDDEHRDYRYISTFPDGTYSVKEDDVVNVVGGKPEQDKKLTGVPKENVISNFAVSVASSDNKTKMSSGRWKKRNSTNVDFMPYLINVDPLLLPYDMFVDGTESDVSTSSFSLDWYLISGWPKFDQLNDVQNNYQYIGKRVSIDDLKSVEYDYFTDYLTVGHGDETFINGSERAKKFLWTVIEHGVNGYTTTFKGLPLQFSSPKINLNGTKFAAILQVENDLEVPTRTTLIYNQEWNVLTLLVQINIDSYFIDGSIGLEQLYQLRVNSAKTDTSVLYGPMIVHGAETLAFNKVDRAYNEEDIVVTNVPIPSDDYYEYNQYQYENVVTIKYDESASDIELFGVRYFPNVDYIITGKVFSGTKYETSINLVIPRSRIRGVYDPQIRRERLFIDGLYGDDFFAVLADIDGAPIATYATFISANTIKINGTIPVSNTYYPETSSVDVNENTSIYNAKVYAIGDWPVYRDIVNDVSVSSIMTKMQSFDFTDILVSTDSSLSKTNMVLSYSKPPVVRPLKTKNAKVDEFGNITIEEKDNTINLFRLDGGFEPSYKNIISFAASEDLSITRQLLNSFKGYNTQLIGVNQTNLWFRRVSDQGVNTGNINVNGTILKVPYALGRKSVPPTFDVWSEEFYSKAVDNFIDVPIEGLQDPKDYRFFLSSKVMSVPSFFRTSNYSCLDSSVPSNDSDAAVSYLAGSSRLTVQMDFNKIISDYLFSAGVFEFFSSISDNIGTSLSPYDISKEYIERNLLDRYFVESIDVYQKPFSRTEVVSTTESPEIEGFVFANTIGIQAKRFFDFSIPVDGSKQVMLAFNIKRR